MSGKIQPSELRSLAVGNHKGESRIKQSDQNLELPKGKVCQQLLCDRTVSVDKTYKQPGEFSRSLKWEPKSNNSRIQPNQTDSDGDDTSLLHELLGGDKPIGKEQHTPSSNEAAQKQKLDSYMNRFKSQLEDNSQRFPSDKKKYEADIKMLGDNPSDYQLMQFGIADKERAMPVKNMTNQLVFIQKELQDCDSDTKANINKQIKKLYTILVAKMLSSYLSYSNGTEYAKSLTNLRTILESLSK